MKYSRTFCPGITDGSLGDMLYFHNYKRPEFSLDLVEVPDFYNS